MLSSSYNSIESAADVQRPLHRCSGLVGLFSSCKEGEVGKAIAFSGLDGLVTGVGITSACVGVGFSAEGILAVSFACAFADALCMACGQALTLQLLTDDARRERNDARFHLVHFKQTTKETLVDLYVTKGVAEFDATRIVDILANYPSLFLDAMVEGTSSVSLFNDCSSFSSNEVSLGGRSTICGSLCSSQSLAMMGSFTLFCVLPAVVLKVGAIGGGGARFEYLPLVVTVPAAAFALGFFKSRFYEMHGAAVGVESCVIVFVAAIVALVIARVFMLF